MQPDNDLAEKTILVTGASGGIGLEVARMLAEGGARVVAAVRDPQRGAAALASVSEGVEILPLDVSSLASIHTAAQDYHAKHSALDVLVNNAGVAVSGRRRCSVDGHEITWATNVLGPFALTQALLPALHAADAPRVVNVGSSAYGYGKMVWNDLEFECRRFRGGPAYASSKLALLLFTRELARREARLAANCVHPGGIATGIWRELPALVRAILMRILPPPSRGALPVVHVATAPELAHVSGRFFHGMRERDVSAAAKNDAAAAQLWDILAAQCAAQREPAPPHGPAAAAANRTGTEGRCGG